MMTLLDKSQMIRLHLQGKSNREIGRIMHISRNTVGKYIREYEGLQSELEACDPKDTDEVRRLTDAITAEPTYDCSSRGYRKWNAEMDALLDEILAAEEEKRDALGPNKQALTKRQMHELMVAEGHDIGLTTVCVRIDEKRAAREEAYIAQRYEHGDRFEYDFGEVKLYIGGGGCAASRWRSWWRAPPTCASRCSTRTRRRACSSTRRCASSSSWAAPSARAPTTT